jgi:cellulose biosynthesis protein BcsQ
MNIVIINSKGGVGKSTISMQVATTYIFQATGKKVNHFEFDDENQDNVSFAKSSIINVFTKQVTKTNLTNTLCDILVDNENVVIDIGANKTTVYLIEALLKSGMVFDIDLFLIPLTDGESDAKSAIKIYKQIKTINKDAKIIFVLNRAIPTKDVKSQFDIFLGDPRSIFNECGLIEEIPKKDRHIVTLEDSEVIKYSKNFGLTIWELAISTRDIDLEMQQALKQNVSKDVIKTLSFKRTVKEDCLEYLKTNLHTIFIKLDNILKK